MRVLRNFPIPVAVLLLSTGLLWLSSMASTRSEAALLQATVTPAGPTIIVPDLANVRTGPGADYDLVGVLVKGQSAPAIGRSSGGDWIQIRYVGVPQGVAWVYAPLVILSVASETLPIVEPPPTSTPQATATLDPTLAARFTLVPSGPTRLPTFTPAPPVVLPTLIPGTGIDETGGFPPALAIIGLFVIGVFGTIVSFIRRR